MNISKVIIAFFLFFLCLNLQAKDQKTIQLKPEPGLMTQTIQNAINSCAEKGGGVVLFSSGNYLSGGIELKSHVTLYFEKGAILQGSDQYADYKNDAFIYGKELKNVSISGEGTIDGVNCINKYGEEGFRGPHCVRLINCKNISLEGFTIKNSANWAINCRHCSNGKVDKVSIRGGHDGLHTRFCNDFTVTNCDFRTGDDAFAGNDNQNFSVDNCQINSSCNGFRFGCLNLVVSNCHIWGPGESEHKISKRKNMLAAFVHFSPDDEHPKLASGNWLIKDVTIENADCVYLYNHKDGLWQTGQPASNIIFENIQATGLLNSFIIQDKETSKFDLQIVNSSFTFREKAENSINTFEGAKLQSTGFFNATSFNKISLKEVTLVQKTEVPIMTFSKGKSVFLDHVVLKCGDNKNPLKIENVENIKKQNIQFE